MQSTTCCNMQHGERSVLRSQVPRTRPEVHGALEHGALFIPSSMRVVDPRAERYFSSGSGSKGGTMNEAAHGTCSGTKHGARTR